MSRIVAAAAMRGAKVIASQAQQFLDRALAEKPADTRVEFPETAYYLPMAYTLLGVEAKTLNDLRPIMAEVQSLLHEPPGMPYGYLIWGMPWTPELPLCGGGGHCRTALPLRFRASARV